MSTARLTFGQRVQRLLVVGLGRLPRAVLRIMARPPVNGLGERMEPDVAFLMKLTASGDDYSDLEPSAARAQTEAEAALFIDRVPPCAVEEEVEIADGLLATRYSTEGASRDLIIFFHGGGFVLGSRASYAAPARMLAQGTGADVLSVEYRLAPEDPFPAPLDDAVAAWDYAVEHAARWGADPRRITIAGESAGANIAAVLAQAVKGGPVQPLLQVLIQPVTDLAEHHPSQAEFADSPALTAKQVEWFVAHYLPEGTDLADPRVSPLRASDLSGLPRTIVAVGGFDPLRDDGIAYATALLTSGVPTEVVREAGQVHGYISFTAISPSCKAATKRLVSRIAHTLAETPDTKMPSSNEASA